MAHVLRDLINIAELKEENGRKNEFPTIGTTGPKTGPVSLSPVSLKYARRIAP